MGQQTDEAANNTLQVFLPVDTLEQCCLLKSGQSLCFDGSGNQNGSEADEVTIHMKRFEQHVALEIKALHLHSLLRDGCYSIHLTAKQNTAKCQTGISERKFFVDQPHSDDATLKSEWHEIENTSRDEDGTLTNARDGSINNYQSALGTIVTRSRKRSLQESSPSTLNQRTNSRLASQINARSVIERSSLGAVSEVEAPEAHMDNNSVTYIHQSRCGVSGNHDFVQKDCVNKRKTFKDEQPFNDTSRVDTSNREECMDKKALADVGDCKDGSLSINLPAVTVGCDSHDMRRKRVHRVRKTRSHAALSSRSRTRVHVKQRATNSGRNSHSWNLSKKQSPSDESSSVCDVCSKSFSSVQQLNRHRAIKHSNQSVLCPKCGKCFKTHRALSSHLGSAHSKQWPFRCERCERVFKLQKKLDSHNCALIMKASQQESSGNRSNLLDDDKSRVPCPLCDASKVNYNSLYKHFLVYHKEHPKYAEELAKLKPMMRVQCDRCGLDFSTTTNLRKHMKLRKCTDQQSSGLKSGEPCPFCAKISASITHLAQHMRLMHRWHPRYEAEEKKLRLVLTVQCDVCGNWYPDKGSLRQHHTNAHAEDRHRCPYCRKPFRLRDSMQIHINRRHLGLPYEKSTRRYFRTCKHCPRSFLTKDELELHVKVDHREKKKVHQCDKCSFMYSETREYFLHHRKVHLTDSTQCPGCGASFTSAYFLKKHISVCPSSNEVAESLHRSNDLCYSQTSKTKNADNTRTQDLQISNDDTGQNVEALCSDVGEKLVQIVPVITPAAVHGCSQDQKDSICDNILLSNVFNDCAATDDRVPVSQVTEVTVDGTSHVTEEALITDHHKGIQVVEDVVADTEQVIYLPAGSSLDVSQLPLGTVIETADGSAFWNST